MHSKGRSRRRAAVRPRLDLARRRATTAATVAAANAAATTAGTAQAAGLHAGGRRHGDRLSRGGLQDRRHRAGDQPGPHRSLQRQVGHRAAGGELRRLHVPVDRGPDLHQHPRRRHRRPGPRLQERGADPDQQPSCRHRQHLQAVDRRRRARRDRPWPGLRRLRQPEHGRRDQHHPEDRPHRRARHLHRGGRRLVELCRRQGAERRQHRHLRLVRRRQRRPAGRLSGGWRTGRVEHGLEPLRRHRRVRLADRPEQSHRHHRTIRRRLRHRLSRLERQHLRQRQSLQRFDRLHLERQDAQRPRSLHVPGLLRL